MQQIDKLEIKTAVPTDKIVQNILDARKRCLTPIYDCSSWREGMPIALVGGGPSLTSQLEKLKDYKFIMACGSVHDYLVENNIIPTWTVVCDPDPLMINYLQKICYSCIYLLASQCSNELFDYFEGKKGKILLPGAPFKPQIYIWNCDGLHFDREVFGEKAVYTGGGCTVGTRAMALAMQFGYFDQHLFGFDTCVKSDQDHHAYKFDNPEVETIGNTIDIQLEIPDGPTYKVAGYMLGQYFDFKNILEQNAHRLRVTVHGEGLLSHHMDIANKKAKEYLNGNS